MQRLLITGASGTLRQNVARIATQQGWEVCGTYHMSSPPAPGQWLQLDVSDRQAVMAVLGQIQPTAVIHMAFRQHGELCQDHSPWAAGC
jgi:dTDP-4-dehydrorhamnose reductase